MLKASCRKCGKLFAVPDDKAGKRFKCTRCATIVIVPTPAEERDPWDLPPVSRLPPRLRTGRSKSAGGTRVLPPPPPATSSRKLPQSLQRGTRKSVSDRPRFGSVWADAAIYGAVGVALSSLLVLGFAYGGSVALSKLRSQFEQVRNKPLLEEKAPAQAPKSMDDGKRPGEEWAGNGLKMQMCWCPAGNVLVGSPSSEPGRGADEDQSTKAVAKGYWISKFEITQAEYEQIVGENPSRYSPYSMSKKRPTPLPEGPDNKLPVDLVSYGNAVAFCAKLTAKERREGRLATGWVYTLPTEVQWEHACRAGTTTPTAFGDKLSSTQANFDGNQPYNGGEGGKLLDRLQPVGQYQANSWGICDMHGNAAEWCRDYYSPKPGDGSAAEVGQPLEVTQNRVVRGGDFHSPGAKCRSASRSQRHMDQPDYGLGFRVVMMQASEL